jgi:hypothetical protein
MTDNEQQALSELVDRVAAKIVTLGVLAQDEVPQIVGERDEPAGPPS